MLWSREKYSALVRHWTPAIQPVVCLYAYWAIAVEFACLTESLCYKRFSRTNEKSCELYVLLWGSSWFRHRISRQRISLSFITHSKWMLIAIFSFPFNKYNHHLIQIDAIKFVVDKSLLSSPRSNRVVSASPTLSLPGSLHRAFFMELTLGTTVT